MYVLFTFTDEERINIYILFKANENNITKFNLYFNKFALVRRRTEKSFSNKREIESKIFYCDIKRILKCQH